MRENEKRERDRERGRERRRGRGRWRGGHWRDVGWPLCSLFIMFLKKCDKTWEQPCFETARDWVGGLPTAFPSVIFSSFPSLFISLYSHFLLWRTVEPGRPQCLRGPQWPSGDHCWCLYQPSFPLRPLPLSLSPPSLSIYISLKID